MKAKKFPFFSLFHSFEFFRKQFRSYQTNSKTQSKEKKRKHLKKIQTVWKKLGNISLNFREIFQIHFDFWDQFLRSLNILRSHNILVCYIERNLVIFIVFKILKIQTVKYFFNILFLKFIIIFFIYFKFNWLFYCKQSIWQRAIVLSHHSQQKSFILLGFHHKQQTEISFVTICHNSENWKIKTSKLNSIFR